MCGQYFFRSEVITYKTIILSDKMLYRMVLTFFFIICFKYQIPGLLEFKLIARNVLAKKGCFLDLRHNIPMISKFTKPKAANGGTGAHGANGIDGTDGIQGTNGNFYFYLQLESINNAIVSPNTGKK